MQNHDTELALVAALMKDNSRIMEVSLIPEEFAFEEPRSIYRAIQELTAQRMPADIITVADYMEDRHGGANWFERIQKYVANSVCLNAKAYAAAIRSDYSKRRAVEIANTLIESANTGQEAVDVAIKGLMHVGGDIKNHDFGIKEGLRLAVDSIDASMDAKGLMGTASGLSKLDEITGGFHDGDFIVIGGRPAMGKTAVMLNFAIGAGVPVGVVSSEQGVEQVCSRMISIRGRVSANRLRNAKNLDLDDYDKITLASTGLMDSNIRINDMPGPSVADIARQARQWKYTHGIKALYIDYIQRIKSPGAAPKHEKIGDIAMAFKELARELNIPVIALAQINRAVDLRPCKRPGMSDLKDSGGIEQEADMVITLYRDEVYNTDPNNPERGTIEIGIPKNRHGPTGFVKAAWNGECMRVDDLEHRY